MEQNYNKKIFISDLDGTLIDNALKNNDEVSQCIHHIINHQDEFVVATGRTLYGIQLLDFYTLPLYLIAMNGALILDKEKNVIYEQRIEEYIVNDILSKYPHDNIEFITKEKTYTTLSKEDYIERYSQWDLWKHKMLSKGQQDQMDFMLSHFEFQADINQVKDCIIKINILELDQEKYKEKVKYVNQYKTVQNNPFSKNVIELTSQGVTKKEAILKLMKMNAWKKDHIYVFGDGDNDSDMLSYFQNSYAPENASSKAKQSAKHLIGQCSSNSVIHQIYNITKY